VRSPSVLAAGLLLLGSSVAACGSDGPPTDASTKDYCVAWVNGMDAKSGKDTQKWAETLNRVGTPAAVTKDQRAGFEALVAYLGGIDGDVAVQDIKDPGFSDLDQRHVDALIQYTTTQCIGEIQGKLRDQNGDLTGDLQGQLGN